MSIPFRQTALGGLLLGLCACSSSSSGSSGDDFSTDVEGLSAPDQVSVVTASEEESLNNGGLAAPAVSDFSPGSDYMTDTTFSYVYDPSMEALDQVNSILCYLAMTAYPDMVNQGAYIAQLDTSLCESGDNEGSAGSEQGQSSSATGAEYEYFTVESTRANDGAVQRAHIWVPQEDEDMGPGGGEAEEQTIYVEIEVEEGASDDNPFGVFSMSYAGAPSFAEIEDAIMRGRINTIDTDDAVAYQYFESFGDVDQPAADGEFGREVRLVVTMDEDRANGVAKVSLRERYNFGMGDSGIQEEVWRMAFNETHFKRQAGEGDEVTLSREEFNTSVWRYFLYNADGDDAGQRVELESGFPFVTEAGDHGWAGYHGVWIHDDADVESGDTVFRQEFGSNEQGEAYEIVMAPGRLIKSERNELDLTELDGANLQFWDWQSGEQYLCEYSMGAFFTVAVFDHEDGTWTETDPTELFPQDYGGHLGFWSDSLGGQVNWVDGDDVVTFYKESFVTGADDLFTGTQGEAALYGMVDALAAELTGEDAEQGDIYLPFAETAEDSHRFVFSADDLGLYYDENGDGSSLLTVGLADGEEPEDGPFMWGMRSGPMVASLTGIEEPHDIWNAEVFYSYETGHNPWNRYSALRDTMDAFVEFDAPLQFLYAHSTENDRDGSSDYDGQSFFLEYNGDGGLHGIPHEPVGADGVEEFERWYPVFSIADGVAMGPDGNEYVIKAIDMELTLQEDNSGSGALNLAGADLLTLPDSSDFEMPDTGEKPDVNDPPAVLNGEVLSSSDSE